MGLFEQGLVFHRIRVLRAQAHIAGEETMAVGMADRIELAPFLDRRLEGGNEAVGERRLAAVALLDLRVRPARPRRRSIRGSPRGAKRRAGSPERSSSWISGSCGSSRRRPRHRHRGRGRPAGRRSASRRRGRSRGPARRAPGRRSRSRGSCRPAPPASGRHRPRPVSCGCRHSRWVAGMLATVPSKLYIQA